MLIVLPIPHVAPGLVLIRLLVGLEVTEVQASPTEAGPSLPDFQVLHKAWMRERKAFAKHAPPPHWFGLTLS